jgi:hypothetical protein
MSQPQSTKNFMCVGCGELFDLTGREKANNLKCSTKKRRTLCRPDVRIPCCLILSDASLRD